MKEIDGEILKCYYVPIFASLLYLLISIGPIHKSLVYGIPHEGMRITTSFFIILGGCFIFCKILDIYGIEY